MPSDVDAPDGPPFAKFGVDFNGQIVHAALLFRS